MESWLGPALIAALVSGLVSISGWFATYYIGLRRDQMLRDEKIRDFQVALRAEVLSDLLTMTVADRRIFLKQAAERYAGDPDFSVIVPHMARNAVFEALIGELHVLPSAVIEQVTHYERMRDPIERFIDDLRGGDFRHLPHDRQLLMYSDYLEMVGRLEALAQDALAALELSLNIPDGDRWTHASASEEDAASALRRKQP